VAAFPPLKLVLGHRASSSTPDPSYAAQVGFWAQPEFALSAGARLARSGCGRFHARSTHAAGNAAAPAAARGLASEAGPPLPEERRQQQQQAPATAAAAGAGAGSKPSHSTSATSASAAASARSLALKAGAAVAAAAAAWRSSAVRASLLRAANHARRTSAGQAAALQAAALWQAHSGKVSAAAALVAAYLLYQTALAAAGLISDAPETHPILAPILAAAGSLAAVAAAAAGLRARTAVNADHVYRLALVKLNSHAGVLEVMGAPLAGSPVRAEVASGGGIYLSGPGGGGGAAGGLWPARRRPRRIQMAFGVTGSVRSGLALVAARKRRGKYEFKLLAVELPEPPGAAAAAAAAAPAGPAAPSGGAAASAGAAGGGAARLFVAGDAKALAKGSVVRELAAPLARAVELDTRHQVGAPRAGGLRRAASPGCDSTQGVFESAAGRLRHVTSPRPRCANPTRAPALRPTRAPPSPHPAIGRGRPGRAAGGVDARPRRRRPVHAQPARPPHVGVRAALPAEALGHRVPPGGAAQGGSGRSSGSGRHQRAARQRRWRWRATDAAGSRQQQRQRRRRRQPSRWKALDHRLACGLLSMPQSLSDRLTCVAAAA
jgi:hypothetical protein